MKRDILAMVFVTAFSAAAVGAVRPRVVAIHERVKETTDVYVLPPARQVLHLSLGYRAALADYLWAHVLVSQGLHTFEKRRFENLTALLDAINELDPTFREPYLKADALITFQAAETPHHEVLKAREILERGTRNLPFDADVWLALGEFMAYEAPSYLKDESERKEWRVEGAQVLARAAELGASTDVAWHAIGGANILSKAGEREAAIRFYERVLALTEDEELRQTIYQRLAGLTTEREADARRARLVRLRELRDRDLPFVNMTTLLVLGPPFDAALCSGRLTNDNECPQTWTEWLSPAKTAPEIAD